MDVTVVVCTYDRVTLAHAVLDALARQRAGARYEVVLVDNGPDDRNTSAYGARIGAYPVPLRVVRCPTRGISAARNAGVAAARGTYVAFTDDDCVPRHDWVQRVYAGMVASGADAAGGRVILADAWRLPEWAWRRRVALAGVLPEHDLGADVGPHPEVPAPIGANMVIRRDVAVENRFREGFGLGTGTTGEDTELFERMRAAGRSIAYLGDAVVYHRYMPGRLAPGYLWGWYRQKVRSKLVLDGPSAAPWVIAWTVRDLGRIVRDVQRSAPSGSYARATRPDGPSGPSTGGRGA